MAESDSTGIGLGKDAADVIRAVVTGEIDPQVGAAQLAKIWVPAEELGTRAGEPPSHLHGSVASLDDAANQLVSEGQSAAARRLAELNWLLARHAGDEDVAVRCAATLAQLMISDPAAIRRRLDLLEYAVPPILASRRPTIVKAAMLCNLADARFNAAAGDPDAITATLDACKRAISIGTELGDVWLARIHLIAGTVLQDLGDLTDGEDHYRESIDFLTSALRYCGPEQDPDQYASALNNLGNSYRKLGDRTGDAALIHEAIRCYDLALPYRHDAALIRRTQSNRAEALHLLRRLSATTNDPQAPDTNPSTGTNARIAALLAAGDGALTQSNGDEEADEALRRLATDRYLAAAKLADRSTPPRVRAEVYHRLAGGFISAEEDDALWTGVCFAAAAHRLGAGAWRRASLAAVSYHIGFMLMKIGLPDQRTYLRKAEAMLRDSLPPLAEGGRPGELEQAKAAHEGSLTLLAALGDEDARTEALQLNASRQLQRLDREAQQDPRDGLHLAYREYLDLVRLHAGRELGLLLASGELSEAWAVVDQAAEDGAKALTLTREASARRDVGDLAGALTLAARAERYAASALLSAPSVWCQLSSLYAQIPAADKAGHCLQRARATMEHAYQRDGPAGDEPWWFPDKELGLYRQEIEAAAADASRAGRGPQFDPAATVSALIPTGSGDQLRTVLEEGLRSIRKTRLSCGSSSTSPGPRSMCWRPTYRDGADRRSPLP